MNKVQLLCLAFIAILLFGCAPRPAVESLSIAEPNVSDGIQWPTEGWKNSLPEEQGVDPTGLNDAVELGREMDLHSFLVIRHGFIISETYFNGFDSEKLHDQYSVTKSFTATLMGIAIDEKLIPSIDEPVTDALPQTDPLNKDANKAAMKLRDLLTMTSGLDWIEGDPTYRAMYFSPDWVHFVFDIAMRETPGEMFNYCSGCSHLLSAAVQQALGKDALLFADEHLFAPLGIKNYFWEKDANGIPIGGWGLQITPRDMAKLGYLYLHKGMWDGRRVVSETWIDDAVKTHVPDTGSRWGYGYQWWTDDRYGGYAARGRYGQLIYVVPRLDLIVVSTAASETGDEGAVLLIQDKIIPSVAED